MTRTNVVLGTVLIAVGVLLLLQQQGLVDAWELLATWWPLIIVVAGLAQLVTRPRNVIGGVLLLVLGGVLLLWRLGVIVSASLLWPVLLIGLGAWLLLGRTGSVRGRDGSIDLAALGDDRQERLPPGPFRGGAITTLFGDARLDLRQTTLEDGAALQVTTIFGDVDLEVPDTWQVVVNGPELFGDAALEPEVGRPPVTGVLRLRVLLVFGDLTVRGTRVVAPSTPRGQPGPEVG